MKKKSSVLVHIEQVMILVGLAPAINHRDIGAKLTCKTCQAAARKFWW